MVKLKCLIFFYFVVNVVYLLTMVFNFNPFIQIKETLGESSCQCAYNSPRNVYFNRLEWQLEKNKSSSEKSVCSRDASKRGKDQKVISYSIFGEDSSQYMRGFVQNVNAVKKYYPHQYIIRLYYNDQTMTDKNVLCDIYCKESNVDLCNVKIIDQYPTLQFSVGQVWRFAPMVDPLVSEFHSRDLDSIISHREFAAVNDWFSNTNRTFHIMRDHKQHGSAIPAGMFGMRKAKLLKNEKKENWIEEFKSILNLSNKTELDDVSKKKIDQTLLKTVIWPYAKNDSVIHDSYTCKIKRLKGSEMRPFPTRRLYGKYNFVGSNGGNITLQKDGPCPKECRPIEHQEWILC